MSNQCANGQLMGCGSGQMSKPCYDNDLGMCFSPEKSNPWSETPADTAYVQGESASSSSGDLSGLRNYTRFASQPDETVGQSIARSAKDVAIAAFSSLFLTTGCSGGPVCGNGMREFGEECDLLDFGGLTCDAFQRGAKGFLKCGNDCKLDRTGSSCEFGSSGDNAPPADVCPTGVECQYGGNIVGDPDWIDATQLTDNNQKRNARVSGKLESDIGRCSATIISPDMVITNHHCVPDATSAASARFYPSTESNVSSDQMFLSSFSCGALVATDCTHDVSVLRCLPNAASSRLPGEMFGIADMELWQEFAASQQVYLIHTNCDYRNGDCDPVKLLSPGTISLYGNECITLMGDGRACSNCRSDAPQARHTCDSLRGSSGGGVFNAPTHRLMGLNWGSVGSENETGGWNYATSLSHLVQSNSTFNNLLMPLAPCLDDDGDGYGSVASNRCQNSGVDCNDNNHAIHPRVREVCDGADNNCDGGTDEGVTRECGDEIGECQKGIQSCANGVWIEGCIGEAKPVPETCDGKDNDCDGFIDNNLSRECGSDVGECRKGVQTCGLGNWGECVGEVVSEAEICDDRDNDCDGQTDNNVDPLREPIERCPDRGICAEGGARNSCVNGVWHCDYPEGYVEEECAVLNEQCGFGSVNDHLCHDQKDNDCDGVVDEHNQFDQCKFHPEFIKVERGDECFVSMQGECGSHGGTYKCVQLAESCGINIDCVGATFPAEERCDGRDRDCDGRIDNRHDIDRDGWGDCAGKMDCDETNPAINPNATEICDGKDNNCNGQVDEGSLCAPASACHHASCAGAAGCQQEASSGIACGSAMWCHHGACGGRYGDNGDGTIIDYFTGLNWTKNDAYVGRCNYPQSNPACYRSAVTYCANLMLAGKQWRLPRREEFHAIHRENIHGYGPCTPLEFSRTNWDGRTGGLYYFTGNPTHPWTGFSDNKCCWPNVGCQDSCTPDRIRCVSP